VESSKMMSSIGRSPRKRRSHSDTRTQTSSRIQSSAMSRSSRRRFAALLRRESSYDSNEICEHFNRYSSGGWLSLMCAPKFLFFPRQKRELSAGS